MQNYTDEENESETEDETWTSLASTDVPTTMTIPTTTTARPAAASTRAPTVAHERKDTRRPHHDSWSDSQSNGLLLQPHSAHTIHKWQSSGNHDSTKDSKGHGQQNSIKNRKGTYSNVLLALESFNFHSFYLKDSRESPVWLNFSAADIKEALQHARKVSLEGSCQWPRARVIPVRDVYPSPSTTYVPHCAILHRCSDDTGCCRSEAFTCVPKLSHRVQLHFYVSLESLYQNYFHFLFFFSFQ